MKKLSTSRLIGLVVGALLVVVAYFWQDIAGLWRFTRAMQAEQAHVVQRGRTAFALAEACIQCHGVAGNGQHAYYPRLSGQSADYLYAQLQAFADGRRQHPMMTPLSMALTLQEKQLVARYFSQSSPRPAAMTPLSAGAIAAGRQLVSQCMACHGATFAGKPQRVGNETMAIPRLAGQSSDYLVRQLQAYRDGSRVDATGAMSGIARAMRDEDMVIIANYLYHLN